VHRAEQLVRTTGPSRSAVARREIVAEDVRARHLLFVEQPPDQRRENGCLPRRK